MKKYIHIPSLTYTLKYVNERIYYMSRKEIFLRVYVNERTQEATITLMKSLQDALISMEFSGQEYWSGLPCPPPGLFLTQGLNLGLLQCRQTPFNCLSQQGRMRLELVISLPLLGSLEKSRGGHFFSSQFS